MKGIINVLKPPNMTSHDVVAVVRRVLHTKKVGHTGTLDPMAAGVLPICVGKATKIVEFLQEDQKTYRAEMTLGAVTDTQDIWGAVLEEKEPVVDQQLIIEAINSFVGEIEQVPPMYSALKVNGKKLCDLAREGKTVERQPRVRHIYSIEIISVEANKAIFNVTCSKGTYIRTLCHDIGQKLGCGAHMSFLLRIRSGNFRIADSLTVEELRGTDIDKDLHKILQPIENGLTELRRLKIDEFTWGKVKNGVKMNLLKFFKGENLLEGEQLLVFFKDEFIALAKVSIIDGHYRIIVDKRFG